MRKAPRLKELSDEDRVLWTLVARSTQPLKGRWAAAVPPAGEAAEEAPSPEKPVVPAQPPVADPKPPMRVSHSLDRPTLDKLSRGRLPIEGKVDLHGLTQDEAYSLLLLFLRRAQVSGIRYVLVITGKGSSSKGDGVLRRLVPAWLDTPPFRALVGSRHAAARQHGGGGALYVRLRRAAG